jgi:hypothetical protein
VKEMDGQQQEQNIEAQPVNNKKRIALFSLLALVLVALGLAGSSASSGVSPMKMLRSLAEEPKHPAGSKFVNGIWHTPPETRGTGEFDDDAPADDNHPSLGQ